jgi:hypothetical protein
MEDLQIGLVYLIDEGTGTIVLLDPFWKYVVSPAAGEKRLFFCQLKDESASLLEHISGEDFTSAEMGKAFSESINVLLPDYKYQKNPYCRGYSLYIEKLTSRLNITSLEGDVETNQELLVKKIRHDEGDGGEDYIHFDYHDAPLYPIIDEIFALKAVNSKGQDLPIEYDIDNGLQGL